MSYSFLDFFLENQYNAIQIKKKISYIIERTVSFFVYEGNRRRKKRRLQKKCRNGDKINMSKVDLLLWSSIFENNRGNCLVTHISYARYSNILCIYR